jgi:hypothetical protein
MNEGVSSMRIPVTFCAMALLGSGGEAAFAHHSFAAFDMKKEALLIGTVSEVQYTNPHAWLFVDVADAKGKTQTWAIEAGGSNILLRMGWKKNTIKVGDKIKVRIHPMRDTSKKGGSLVNIELPDGKLIGG